MNTIRSVEAANLEPEVPMIWSEPNLSRDIAYRVDLEPFNGSQEMLQHSEPFDARTPHGPSQVIFTARVDRDSMWTSSVKIALRREWV